MTEGIEQPNQENIRTCGEKETFKYLGILEADTIRRAEMKETNKKEYIRKGVSQENDKTTRNQII